MASEEERAKILAEYYASVGKGNEEEEADFDDYEVSASEEEDGDGFASADSEDEEDGLTVMLSGRLSCLPNAKVMYKGSWGEKNKFKLRAPAPIDVSDHEAVRAFLENPSSIGSEKCLVFDGYFETDDNQRIEEKHVEVLFKEDLKVNGKGSNQFGVFELSGQYDHKTHSLTLEKTYKSGKEETNGKRRKEEEEEEEEERKLPAKKSKNDEGSDECEF